MTWLEKRGGAAAKVISKVSEAEKMIEEQEVVVVGFFGDLDCEEAKEFREAADKVDEAFFLLTSEADLRKAYSVDSDKTLVLFKDWDEGRVVYDGDMKKSEVHIRVGWIDWWPVARMANMMRTHHGTHFHVSAELSLQSACSCHHFCDFPGN